MAALVKGHIIKERGSPSGRRFPVAAAVVCWEGGLVALSGAGSAAVAAPATAAANLKIVGVATGTADNRIGLAGAQNVYTRRGVFLLDNDATDPLALGDIGSPVYASDDHTVCKTAGTKSQAGILYDVDPSGGVWVEIR